VTAELEIVHVSDVHLADTEPTWLQKHIGVQRGSASVAEALAATVKSLVSRTGPQTVGLLSGDLSTLGAAGDIGSTRIWWEGHAGDSSRYVLGNHDFWNGHPLQTAIKHTQVHWEVRDAHWPLDRITTLSVGDMRVTVYELDSTPRDQITGLVTNVLAQGGRFEPLTSSLREAVYAQGAWGHGPDVGVVLMHHPVDRLRNGLVAIAELDQNTSLNLVLVGHTHRALMNRFGSGERGYVQATCGSSTIRGRKKPNPSFLVHALSALEGTVRLQTTFWEFDGTTFAPARTDPPIQI